MNCYKCGHPTVFVTIVDIKKGIIDAGVTRLDDSAIVRKICSSCSKLLEDWFE